MSVSQRHNMVREVPTERPFGIRVSLRPGDPFARLVGTDWEKVHWFAAERERDAALEDMRSRHRYSRAGDEPALVFEKVEKVAARRRR